MTCGSQYSVVVKIVQFSRLFPPQGLVCANIWRWINSSPLNSNYWVWCCCWIQNPKWLPGSCCSYSLFPISSPSLLSSSPFSLYLPSPLSLSPSPHLSSPPRFQSQSIYTESGVWGFCLLKGVLSPMADLVWSFALGTVLFLVFFPFFKFCM